jgi:ATP-dependent RNA helicase DeaD
LLLERVKGIIDAGHLGKCNNLVEKLIQEDYTSLEVAAALLKIVVDEGNKN